jgi:hypothetical protein
MGYCVQRPTRLPHPAHCIFTASACMWHECLFLSDYNALFKTCIGKVVSALDIGAEIPSMQQDHFYCRNYINVHICALCISKCKHFCCCHCSCYQYYRPSLILFTCLLPQSFNSEPHGTNMVIWSITINMS